MGLWDMGCKNRNPKEILVPDLITRVMAISVDDAFKFPLILTIAYCI